MTQLIYTVGGIAPSGVSVSGAVVTLTVSAFGTGATPTVAQVGPITDLAGNSLTSFAGVAATDGVAPVITAAATGSSIVLTYSENIDVTTLDGSGFTLSAGDVDANTDPADAINQITLTTSGVGTGDTPDVFYAAVPGTVEDTAGNAAADQTFTGTTDGADPTLDPVSIASDNTDATLAKVGDTVTVSFTSSEDIQTPTVTIAGNAATVLGGPTSWTATYDMQLSDTSGPVAFTIDFTDLTGNAGTQVIAVTDSSSVTFDKTAPTVTVVSSDLPDGTYVDGKITLNVSFSEPVTVVTSGATEIALNSDGNNPSIAVYVSGSGSDNLIFEYDIGTNDASTALDYDGTGSLTIGGGDSIKDLAGNDAVLDLATPGTSGSLSDNQTIIIDTNSITPAIGGGSVNITTNNGVLSVGTPINPSSLPAPPSGVVLNHGLFPFIIRGLDNDASATVTFEFSDPIPTGSAWWKYQLGHTPEPWFSKAIGDDDGDGTITVTLTDGLDGDADKTSNGEISDPGGPAVQALIDNITSVSNNKFDVNSSRDGNQFRLLYTSGSPYSLTSANKGQFMYKLIVTGSPGASYSINADIPYPFETVGTNPVRAPADNSLSITSPTNGVIKIDGYGNTPQLGITKQTISMKGKISPDGSSEITIHLRYGLLGTDAYTPLGNLAADHSDNSKDIPNYAKYKFVSTETNSNKNTAQSEIIESENEFKKIAGFGGVVKDTIGEDPIPNAKITITGPGVPAGAFAITDPNGYYQYVFKYTGKSTSFAIKLESSSSPLVYGSMTQYQNAKSNSYLITNFIIPGDITP